MFHILLISSTTLSALRCKQCLTIILRQDSITEFISYDKEQFGLLEPFKYSPKVQTQAEYFVLSEQISYYSTIKVIYERSLIKNYHPFFKMHMLELTCAQCTLPLGYQVQTVNENTLWMQNRIIIDVQSCVLLKDGKDQMNKLIKTLKTRLIRKLVQEKELKKDIEQKEKKDIEKYKKKMKQKGIIQKLQNMYDQNNNNVKKKKKGPKNKIFQSIEQKIPQSLVTTNISSMNIMTSKQDTYPINQDQEQKKHKVVEEKEEASAEEGSCEKVSKQIGNCSLIDKDSEGDEIIHLRVTEEQRQQIAVSLQQMRQRIVKQSHFLQSRPAIDRIMTSLKKLSSQQKYIHNKVPSQLLTLNLLLTLIRKRYIQNPHNNN